MPLICISCKRDDLDANGLRDFILDYGMVVEFNEPHHLNDNYHLLSDEIDNIDETTQPSITKLQMHRLFGYIHKIYHLDFSDYGFTQLEILALGYACLQSVKSLCFTSIIIIPIILFNHF